MVKRCGKDFCRLLAFADGVFGVSLLVMLFVGRSLSISLGDSYCSFGTFYLFYSHWDVSFVLVNCG